ncbi:CHAP domain-containing protein [Candidatus Saccharibacteria bacterium]|nr:CHAP domain-containing protein [Candidatus Saccharibacteria bacterium]
MQIKQNKKPSPVLFQRARLVAIGLIVVSAFSIVSIVHADIYDQQINSLQSDSNSAQGLVSGLQSQAGSYQEAIDQLNGQISAVRSQISANVSEQANTQTKIVANQNDIIAKKASLSASIKAMYLDGQATTIEQLATSKNLSDYIDKEEYRSAVQNQLNNTIKDINAIQAQLQKQKSELDQLVASQKTQNDQLSAAQYQQAQLLAYNQGQQAAYNNQIAANSGKIADLRKAQIAANARFIGSAGTGPTCGGGYPSRWCNIGQDTVIDSWGMYNRECVSYTAFRVAASGRNMPYWGGIGNANQWDDNARQAGYKVNSTPEAGAVAISNNGAYGHAMYVESVNSDGTFNLSQYNAALDGRYSTRSNVAVGNLVFIHF